MKLRIFALAFSIGFVFCLSSALFFIFAFPEKSKENLFPENSSEAVFLEEEQAVFLLVFKDGNKTGPFTVINFDAKSGRIPVFKSRRISAEPKFPRTAESAAEINAERGWAESSAALSI